MDDKNKAPHEKYSLDEILAEARADKDHQGEQVQQVHREKPLAPEEIVRQASEALNIEAADEPPAADENVPKKKKHFSLFGRRHKADEEPNEEDDLYYGLQLKPLAEYRNEYEETMDAEQGKGGSEFVKSGSPYFSGHDGEDMPKSIDETFERVHKERRERLEKIMRQAGMEPDDIFRQDGAQSHENRPVKEEPPQPPRVEPEPLKEPEVKPPLTEPVNEPPQPPEMPEGPDIPGISDKAETENISDQSAGEDGQPSASADFQEPPLKAEEHAPPAPVGEPYSPPRVKEEQTVPPAVKEPETSPRPQYRADDGVPMCVVELDNFEEALNAEAESYPASVFPPAPIAFPANTRNADVTQPKESEEADESDDGTGGELPDEEEQDSLPEDKASVNGTKTIEFPINFEPRPESQKPEKHFHFFGTEETDNSPAEETPPEDDEIDDYTKPTDAPSVLNELAGNVSKLFIRLIATGIITLILLFFSVAYEYPAFLTPEIHKLYTEQVFLIIHLAFLFIDSLFCLPIILNGLKGLFKFQANCDSAAAAATAAVLIQNAVLLIQGLPSGIHLYSVLAAVALFLNMAGKFSMEKRILRNFRYISSPEQKYAVQIFDDHNTALNLAKGCVVGEPQIAYQSKANFLKHFLSLSYAQDPSEHTSQISAEIGFIASLVLCIISSILTKNVTQAVTAFTAAACVCVPFTNMLSVNLPIARLNKMAARLGAMISGWSAVEHFSETNAVMLDTKDLFPRGTVILNGIKTFGGQRIDDAILDATALMCTVGGPLSDLFDQIIKSRRDILPKVSSASYEDEKGVVGMVDGRKILVGNRELIKAGGIEPPSRDYEKKYLTTGKKLVYLASNSILVAVFIVSYRSDRHRAMELKRMENNGISLIVRTRDPNVTPAFLSDCFGISANSVTVLSEHLGNIYEGLQSSPPERTDSFMATKGRATVMMRLLTACVRQRGNISIAVALQNAGAALGFALVALFACCSGLGQLSVTALLIFEAFWAAAVIFIPRLRRP